MITACGGDDDSPIVPVETQTAPTDQLDKDGFIDEADQICEEANTTIANLAESTVADPSTVIAEELEVVEGELDQIDSLGAPSEDEATLADFIDALEKLADNLDKQQLAAERDDTDLAHRAPGGGGHDPVRAHARRRGLRVQGMRPGG